MINKVGGSVDRVNAQLDKLDTATDSAVDAVEAVDEAVRTVSFAVKRPVQKLAGFAAGVSHGWSSLRTRRSWGDAVARGQGGGRAPRARSRGRAEAPMHPHRMTDEITLTFPREPSSSASRISCSAGWRSASS